jgi:hypothetical protein
MGMSHDFEIAIAEGATMVRVGTAIFGAGPEHSRFTFERFSLERSAHPPGKRPRRHDPGVGWQRAISEVQRTSRAKFASAHSDDQKGSEPPGCT